MLLPKFINYFPITFIILRNNKTVLKKFQTLLKKFGLYEQTPKGIWDEYMIEAISKLDTLFSLNCVSEEMISREAILKLTTKLNPIPDTFPENNIIKYLCDEFYLPQSILRSLFIFYNNTFIDSKTLQATIYFDINLFHKLTSCKYKYQVSVPKNKYVSQEQHYVLLDLAILCDYENAYKSLNVGIFKIPSKLHNLCGVSYADEFLWESHKTANQVKFALTLWKNTGSLKHLLNENWSSFFKCFDPSLDENTASRRFISILDKVQT